MLIAARDNGFRAKEQERIVLDTVGRYRTAIADFAAMENLDVWYAHLDTESVLEEFDSQFKPKVVKRTTKGAREGAHEGQHDGVLEADAPGGREGADRRPVIADRADRPARAGRDLPARWSGSAAPARARGSRCCSAVREPVPPVAPADPPGAR